MKQVLNIVAPLSACLRLLVVCAILAAPWSEVYARDFGLALTNIDYGPWNDPSECPDGLALTGREALMQSVSPALRAELEALEKRVGTSSAYVTRVLYERRGPNGIDVCENPTAVDDPSMSVGKAAISKGFDLDGGETSSHCPHAEFSGPNGEKGIDNQIRRLTACIRHVRDHRINEGIHASILSGVAVTLLRVTNVDSMENDDDVAVEIYKGRDTFVKDGGGNPLPDATMRVDKNAPLFMAVTRGKISGGVLTTEPVDARFTQFPTEYFIRGAKFSIKLGADGFSEGLLGGYFDIDSFWDVWARNPSGQTNFSCPSLYKSLHKLADGHKNPATGRCTSLSVGFNIKAVRTFVISRASTKPQN